MFTLKSYFRKARKLVIISRHIKLETEFGNNYSSDGYIFLRYREINFFPFQSTTEKETFVTHLKSSGYRTFFGGKYLNQYGKSGAGGVAHVPPGWDWWVGLVGNSRYYNYTLSVNGTAEKHGDDPNSDYLTSIIWKRAKDFLNVVLDGGSTNPFFMMLSTPSCHAPFTPEPKYSTKFSDISAPRTTNFNVANNQSKHWLLRLGKQPLPEDTIEQIDHIFRNRLRTLLTVDDMVSDIMETLETKSQLDNTYIIFTSDNGFHLGQFSLPYDKREPYEFDIKVPFVIRGPSISEGISLPHPMVNVDLAPTILDLANINIPDYMDGLSLKPLVLGNHNSLKPLVLGNHKSFVHESPLINSMFNSRNILIEHQGEGVARAGCGYVNEGLSGCNPLFSCKCSDSYNNTYSCVREVHINDHNQVTKNDVFCLFVDDEEFKEYYDINIDKYQMKNLAKFMTPEEMSSHVSLLRKLGTCSGHECWSFK